MNAEEAMLNLVKLINKLQKYKNMWEEFKETCGHKEIPNYVRERKTWGTSSNETEYIFTNSVELKEYMNELEQKYFPKKKGGTPK